MTVEQSNFEIKIMPLFAFKSYFYCVMSSFSSQRNENGNIMEIQFNKYIVMMTLYDDDDELYVRVQFLPCFEKFCLLCVCLRIREYRKSILTVLVMFTSRYM